MLADGNAIDMHTIAPVLIFLFAFGCGYAWVVYRLGGRKSGYVSVFVAAGVAITLAGLAFIEWQSAALALLCFAASGIPMIAGEFISEIMSRDAAIREAKEQAERTFKEMDGGNGGSA